MSQHSNGRVVRRRKIKKVICNEEDFDIGVEFNKKPTEIT